MIKNFFNKQSIIGLIISIVALFFAFRHVDWVVFIQSFQSIQIIWLIIAAIALIISVWIRALRWQLLFEEPIRIFALFKSEMIGYFGNNVLPLRLGEALRATQLAREEKLSFSYVFGTIVLERIFDMSGVLVITALLFLFKTDLLELDQFKYSPHFILGFIVVLLISIPILQRFKVIDFKGKAGAFFNKFIQGVLSVKRTALPIVVFHTAFIWFLYLVTTHVTQKAMGLGLSWTDSLILLVISTFFISIPSAPGMVGTYHYGVVFAIEIVLGYEFAATEAFAVVMHANMFVLYSIFGAYYMFRSTASFSKLWVGFAETKEKEL